jgi:hypothetical protein
LPVERFSRSASHQYYQLLPSLDDFIAYLQQKVCLGKGAECTDRVESLRDVSYLDIDYDAVAHTVIFNAHWPQSPEPQVIHINAHKPNDKVEVGVLSSERPIGPEDLALGGFLTVIGEDRKPGKWNHYVVVIC